MGKPGGIQERIRLARLEAMRKENEKKAPPLPLLVQGRSDVISEENRRSIAALADRLAPYEELAYSIGKHPDEQVALFEILEEAGVMNESLMKAVRTLGKSLTAETDVKQEKFFKYKPDPSTGEKMLKINIDGFNASVDEQNRELMGMMKRARHERRELFVRFLDEVFCHSYINSLMGKIRRYKKVDALGGFTQAMVDTEITSREGGDPPHQAAAVAWFRLAEDFSRTKKKIEKPKFVGDVSSEAALQELKRITLEETSGTGGWKIPLPGLRWRGADMMCTMRVEKDQPSIVICKIRLEDARGVQIADGHLSRITGDLAVSGTLTVSAGEVFGFFEEAERYRLLRDHVLAGIYKLWKEKDLREEVNVALFESDEEEEEDEKAQNLLSQVRRPSRAEMLKAFEEQYGPQKHREKRAFIEEGELSGYSWRRVLEAFGRCGVAVVMEGDHPKLKYEGKTIDYINRHEPDPRRNRAVVNRTLRKLGISKEDFRKKLY